MQTPKLGKNRVCIFDVVSAMQLFL